MNFCYCNTAIGKLMIAEENNAITNLYFESTHTLEYAEEKETELLKKAKEQLVEYFAGKRTEFQLPLEPKGTEFQKTVWKALQEIPYGQTCSYGEIASKIGNPKSSRAVGSANNKNPISIFIPCHRVIGANGSLVGYGGGLDIKKKLLVLEDEYMNPFHS